MKILKYLVVVSALVFALSPIVQAQPMQADQPTEAIVSICKTMEKHPSPTPEVNYNLLDYAACGQGGLRMYPQAAVASDFQKIPMGMQGQNFGGEIVYLKGLMKTIVMPALNDGQQRFRFSWLDFDQLRRKMKFSSKPTVSKKGDKFIVTCSVTNPLDKPISGTEAVLTLQGSNYLEPFKKPISMLNPGETKEISFEVPAYGDKLSGKVHIWNYGRIYIDIEETL